MNYQFLMDRMIITAVSMSGIMSCVFDSENTAFAQSCPPVEIYKLTASDGENLDSLGSSVSISNSVAILGAPQHDLTGVAYVFSLISGEQLRVLRSSGSQIGDLFGTSVAVNTNRAVIGASLDDDNGQDSGSAYIFDVPTGDELFKLVPADGAAGDAFGVSVAIDGAGAIVGSMLDDDNGTDSGSAYVFNILTGEELFKLTPSDGAAEDQFGVSVALSGNLAVIGARWDDDNGTNSGAAYVFDISTGQELFKLTASDGAGSDHFGDTVAIDGVVAVVGAPLDDDNGSSSGSAYLFDVSTGQEIVKLTPSNGAASDFFGSSVAIDGQRALIGARADDDNNQPDSGSAYVFDASTGQQLSKITASDAAEDDDFGAAVDLHQDNFVIGSARDDDNGSDSGSAYVFKALPAFDVDPNPLVGLRFGDFSACGLSPDKRTWLLYSFDGLKPTFIRRLNIVIDLDNPLVASTQQSDAGGTVEWEFILPAVANPQPIWLQVVQDSRVTNYVATDIVP